MNPSSAPAACLPLTVWNSVMANHPNRARVSHGLHPSSAEVAAIQDRAGHTDAQAADCIGVQLDAWQAFREGRRKMPPGLWEYYRLHCTFPSELAALLQRLDTDA